MDFNNDDNIDYQLNKIAANIIREKRIKKGYSLEELADKIGNIVTRQSLYRYENNEARMKNSIFQKICLALDEEPSEVWKEINNRLLLSNKTSSQHSLESLINEVNFLDNEDKIFLKHYISEKRRQANNKDSLVIGDKLNNILLKISKEENIDYETIKEIFLNSKSKKEEVNSLNYKDIKNFIMSKIK